MAVCIPTYVNQMHPSCKGLILLEKEKEIHSVSRTRVCIQKPKMVLQRATQREPALPIFEGTLSFHTILRGGVRLKDKLHASMVSDMNGHFVWGSPTKFNTHTTHAWHQVYDLNEEHKK